jgi:uncharacterized protein with von Willebrand factor type A (vWA) domain
VSYAGPPAGGDLADLAGRLGHLLHAAGVPVTAERSARLAATLSIAFPATSAELYWAARVTLLSSHEHIGIFDRVFAQVFGGFVDPADRRGERSEPQPTMSGPSDWRPRQPESRAGFASEAPAGRRLATSGDDDGGGDESQREAVMASVSADERLKSKDFGSLTADELVALRVLTDRMAFVTPHRRSHRQTRSPKGSEVDYRATLRKARRTGGVPFRTVRRRHRTRPRRLVLICDISGSMESYARAYLQLLVSGVDGANAEAFVFATRLTRLTRVLKNTTPEIALLGAGRAAPDWSGGTRIGAAIKAFNDAFGRRGLARGAVVVILSDGWDLGDASVLEGEMARLQRLAFRVIWINPRKASPSYQPLTAGMTAALPHVDTFLSGHSLQAFDEVLAAIRSHT